MPSAIANFNSIKVRLEHSCGSFDQTGCLFQFHKGAIRTKSGEIRVVNDIHFNSIKVRLELIALSDDERRVENFNSIKVRLERSCLKG